MSYFRVLCGLVLSLGLITASAHADDHHHDHDRGGCGGGDCRESFDRDLNERDFDSLREFVHSKRVYDIQEKACSLTISGDVRAEWRHMNEFQGNASKRHNYPKNSVCALRGHNSCCKGHNDFDVECNLRFDYVNDCAWAVAHLQFDDSAGVSKGKECKDDPQGYHGSGTDCKINLRKAYMGYHLYSDCLSRCDIEIGRRQLYNVFDSQIQFLSRCDGITLKYSSDWDKIGDWYWNTMGFVVNENINHFAIATETGLLNINGSGLDLKYSLIYWRKTGRNSCGVNDPQGFKFLNSQFTFTYYVPSEYLPESCNKPLKFYGAFLVNHIAPRWTNSDCKKCNLGWYIGATYGRVLKENDFSIDVQYQYVEAQAVPDRDVSGIGRGNCQDDSFTQPHHSSKRARGNGNYKGARVEFLYALTDNLTLDSIIEFSTAIDKKIGGIHRYSKFELEAIYAF